MLTAPGALLGGAASSLASVRSPLRMRTPEPRPAPAAERHVRRLAPGGCCRAFSTITVRTMFLLYGTHGPHLGSSTLGPIFAAAPVGISSVR